jgi:Protein of unknown function (DUF2911).
MRKIILGIIAFATTFSVSSQSIKTPPPSPPQTIKQDFGLSSIELSYSRPGVKGRKVFGDLVPYGKFGARVPIALLQLTLQMM